MLCAYKILRWISQNIASVWTQFFFSSFDSIVDDIRRRSVIIKSLNHMDIINVHQIKNKFCMRCRLMYATVVQSSPSPILTKMSYSLINQTKKQTRIECSVFWIVTHIATAWWISKSIFTSLKMKKKTINCMGTMQLKYCLNDENQVHKYWIEQICIEAMLNCFNIECNRQLFSLYVRATDVDIVCTIINFFNERWNTYTSM